MGKGEARNVKSEAAKNNDLMEKTFKQKLFMIKLPPKSQWAHISIFSRTGAKGLGRLIWLKHYYVPKWQIAFTLRLNVPKNSDFMEKPLSKSCLELNSLQKSQWAQMPTSLQSGTRGLQRLICFRYYIALTCPNSFITYMRTGGSMIFADVCI